MIDFSERPFAIHVQIRKPVAVVAVSINTGSLPIPLQPEQRLLLVNEAGCAISEHAIQMSWRNMLLAAIEEGVIGLEDRFGTHGCKHRGVSDTLGNRHDKQAAAGHRNERMMDTCDHAVPVVPASERQKPA